MTLLDPALDAFAAAVEEGSFARASKRLFLSPTAVMKQVNALEKRLGMRLLERTSHGVAPTPAGEVLELDGGRETHQAPRAGS